jgi:hypothetical protein
MNEPIDPFNFGVHFEIQHKLNMKNDRRVDMPIEEAISRLERVVSDNCDDLRKKEGGSIYAEELMSAWKKILNETRI